MYAIQPKVPDRALPAIVNQLAASGARAVVVVDDATRRPMTTWSGWCGALAAGSPCSPLTMRYLRSSPPAPSGSTRRPRPSSKRSLNMLPGCYRRLTGSASHARRGFPGSRDRIGSEAGATQLVDPRAGQLIDSFVVGRAPRDADLLLSSATLLSAFRLVRVDTVNTGWLDPSQAQTTEDYLAPIAALGRHITCEELYAATQRLAERGVFKRRGGLGAIQPRPIAIRLAERQWKGGTAGNGTRCFRAVSGPAWPG